MPYKRYEENQRLVYFALKKFFPNLFFDEDARQTARLGLWKACMRYDGSGAFSTFATTCIYNELVDMLRLTGKVKENEQLILDSPVFSESDDRDMSSRSNKYIQLASDDAYELRIFVDDFVSQLPEHLQNLVLLRKSGYKQKEIAEQAGITSSGVSHMMQTLNKRWREYCA